MAKKRMKRIKKKEETKKVTPKKVAPKKDEPTKEVIKKVEDTVEGTESGVLPVNAQQEPAVEVQIAEPSVEISEETNEEVNAVEPEDEPVEVEVEPAIESDEEVAKEVADEVEKPYEELVEEPLPVIEEAVDSDKESGKEPAVVDEDAPELPEEELPKEVVEELTPELHTENQPEEEVGQVLEEPEQAEQELSVEDEPDSVENDLPEFGEIKPVEEFGGEGVVTTREDDYEAQMGAILERQAYIEELEGKLNQNLENLEEKAEELANEIEEAEGLQVTEDGLVVSEVNAHENPDDELFTEDDEEEYSPVDYPEKEPVTENTYSLEDVLAEETFKINNHAEKEPVKVEPVVPEVNAHEHEVPVEVAEEPEITEPLVSENAEFVGEPEDEYAEPAGVEPEKVTEDKPKEVVSIAMRELMKQKLELSKEDEILLAQETVEKKNRLSREETLLDNIKTDLSNILPFSVGKRIEGEINAKSEYLKRAMEGKVEEEQKEQERKDRESIELRAEYARMTEENTQKSSKKGLFGRKRGG